MVDDGNLDQGKQPVTLSIWQEKRKSSVRCQEECNRGPGTYNTLLAHNVDILLIYWQNMMFDDKGCRVEVEMIKKVIVICRNDVACCD